MAGAMRRPADDETTSNPLEHWERLEQQLDESLADLSEEERQALADEISEAIDERLRDIVLDLRNPARR